MVNHLSFAPVSVTISYFGNPYLKATFIRPGGFQQAPPNEVLECYFNKDSYMVPYTKAKRDYYTC